MAGALLHVGDALEANFTLALDGAGDDSLVACVGAAPALDLAAHKRFIDFNDPNQRRASARVVTHGFADAVAQIPSGTISCPERAVELVGGHALFGRAHQVDGGEPPAQRQVRSMHAGARRDAEVIMA